MNILQRLIIFVRFGLVCLNVLFPPRIYEFNHSRPAQRAFIGSEEFHKTDIEKMNEKHGDVTILETSNPTLLDSGRLWIYTVAIAAATISLAAASLGGVRP